MIYMVKEFNVFGKEHAGRGVQFGDFIRNTHSGECEFKADYSTQITEDVNKALIKVIMKSNSEVHPDKTFTDLVNSFDETVQNVINVIDENIANDTTTASDALNYAKALDILQDILLDYFD